MGVRADLKVLLFATIVMVRLPHLLRIREEVMLKLVQIEEATALKNIARLVGMAT
jgi:hypothetical protein